MCSNWHDHIIVKCKSHYFQSMKLEFRKIGLLQGKKSEKLTTKRTEFKGNINSKRYIAGVLNSFRPYSSRAHIFAKPGHSSKDHCAIFASLCRVSK